MLDTKIVHKIESFVASRPRSLFEVAGHIGKSWRTTDRYVDEIAKEYGTIATRTFREGTRGALKLVYWASVEARGKSIFQDQLEKEILLFKRKEDFSAFDIYQHVPDQDKQAILISKEREDMIDKVDWLDQLEACQRQVLCFSGNLSWLNLKVGRRCALDSLNKLVKRGVSIKAICRVNFASTKNVSRALACNFQQGRELIEIRHNEQPLRAFIFDGKIARIKEIVEPTGKRNEPADRLFLFYLIRNREWVDWLSRVFWKCFSQSIDANRRLVQLESLSARLPPSSRQSL